MPDFIANNGSLAAIAVVLLVCLALAFWLAPDDETGMN